MNWLSYFCRLCLASYKAGRAKLLCCNWGY